MGTDSEKLFSICKHKESLCETEGGETEAKTQAETYQVSDDLLEELGTFLHLILWPSQLDNVTLLCWIRKIDDHLEIEILFHQN